MSEKKMSSSRKHALKSLILQVAKNMLDEEAEENEQYRKSYMEEHCPPLDLPGSMQELQEFMKTFIGQVDKVDEERYDLEQKVGKCEKEVEDLRFKVRELQPVKKPALKKVRMSADSMLKALLGSKHTVNMDLRANLKQVKKEVKEEPAEQVGDWRKNVEDKADRKKMFEC